MTASRFRPEWTGLPMYFGAVVVSTTTRANLYKRRDLHSTGVPSERLGSDMNPYSLIGSAHGTAEAASLSQRLAAWHDAMVTHERRLRAGRTDDGCDEDCAHSDARALWAEALTAFGDRAHELSFLRSRAMTPGGRLEKGAGPASGDECPDMDNHRSSRSAARPTVSGRGQTSFLHISGGRTAEEKREVEL